ncbi:hypothetical protein M2390_003132 [Mycetocola sp. BIGb0189]|uniref:hypothetical protein n=1 Tax=Mycetocola sp. BIGb0189 TaxID=2940604 RepID=UPI002169812B|nr:hypothetical protein [Mycetocola sp. BIGb0189]MCS4277916.1 hypothetical protein [Mycetocola sp. BIGb0189]
MNRHQFFVAALAAFIVSGVVETFIHGAPAGVTLLCAFLVFGGIVAIFIEEGHANNE